MRVWFFIGFRLICLDIPLLSTVAELELKDGPKRWAE